MPSTELPCIARLQGLLPSEKKAQMYCFLGECYCSIKFRQDARYFHAAFNDGIDSTAYYLGKLYFNGQSVQQCFRTAFQYFQIGARNGDVESMFEAGWCFKFGHGTVKYFEMAVLGGIGSGK